MFAHATETDFLVRLLESDTIWILIPLVAIGVPMVAVGMHGLRKIISRSQEHRERMAMIAAGMHPDEPEWEPDGAAGDKES